MKLHSILVSLRRIGLLILCSLLWQSSILLAADAEKLNVVFILADDLGWGEVGAFGQEKIPTPNLDRLASQGLRLTQHYSGAPVCAPSRCVLMTGLHAGHAQIRGNLAAPKVLPEFDEGQYPITSDAVTMAEVFQQAGYTTGAMGKWGLGPVGSSGEPNRQGFDLFFGYNCQAVAHSYYPPHLWKNTEKITINQNPIPGHQRQPEGPVRLGDWIGETYAPKLMIREAVQFIEDNQSQPFFLYLPFIEPHVAMHPTRESVEQFPESWDDAVYRGQCGYLPHPRPRAGYAAMISDLDSYVGQVMDTLERTGLVDSTLVIFSSDNGTTHPRQEDTHFHVGGVDAAFFNSTAGLRGYKGSVYEGGIRVPTIVRLPGKIAAGTTSDAPGYFPDWLPTLCEAVELERPKQLDGISLWPVLTGGSATEPRKPMLWVFPEYGGQVAVRIGDFKVIRQDLKTRTPGPWEVYNIPKDSGESNNIAEQHPEIIAQAKDILRREVAANEMFPLKIPLD